MKCQQVNIFRKIFFCLVLLFLCLISASSTYAETYNFVTKWGSYGSGNGQFYNPNGIAVDSSGNVYVADSGYSRIQKFAPNFVDFPSIIVQLQKRTARGFKNVQYFINVIYIKLGKLKFELPT